MKKYKYTINGLDCPNCSRALEETLNKNELLKNVNINFTTKKITYETETLKINDINKIIKQTEPEAYITEEENIKKEYHITALITGILLGLIGLYTNVNENINKILTLLSILILTYKPFISGIKTLIKNKNINENALIVISVIGAYIIGETLEGIMVVSLYLLGKILEEKAINKSRNSIKTLVDLKQDYANIKEENKVIKKDVNEVKIGDTLIIKQGEKAPVDGIVTKGTTYLDLKSLTGESELVNIKTNDKILSGSINTENIIEIKATNTYENSTVAKILELINDATDKKARTETIVSKISKYYTPLVIIISIIIYTLLPLITNINHTESLYRALTFLVISCPCAIAISVPLSYFTGIGISSKNGILIKGSNFLDNTSQINKIVFDKTGTLTDGSFEVKNIKIHNPKYKEEEIIEILAKGESLSNHPIAKSIIKLYNKDIKNEDVENFKEMKGSGITYKIKNKQIKVGTKKLCNCNIDTSLHLNINGEHVASIEISDGIKEHAEECIKYLKNNNIKTYMFTGDKKEIAETIGKKLNIDEIHSELLPTDKYNLYEKLTGKDQLVAFVGDGINDTPVLKRADIGISMGNIGASSAVEYSDIVIMNDNLNNITKTIKISKYTRKIIIQNLIFAFLVKTSILTLSIFGLSTMIFAVFADTGVTLLTILNTLRILNKFKISK